VIYKREEYLEESPTDQKFPVKQIEVLSSIDGKESKYIGRVSLGLQTPMGVQTIPVSFEVEAASIQEAFAKFSTRADAEVEVAKKELQDELQEMRRRSQNRIVTPGDLPPTDMGRLKL